MRNWGAYLSRYVGTARNFFENDRPDAAANNAYTKAVTVSRQARRELASAYQSGNGDQASVSLTAQATKAVASLTAKLKGLQEGLDKTPERRRATVVSQIDETKAEIGFLNEGESPAEARARAGAGRASTARGRRGPSAETLAKRAETSRVKDVREDEGFASALKQAQSRELQVEVELSDNAQARADLERTRVKDAAVDQARILRDKGPKDPKSNGGVAGDGTINDPREVQALLTINDRTRDLNLQKIDLDQRRQVSADALELDRDARDAKKEDLRAQVEIAGAGKERLRLALQIVDLEYQQRQKDLEALTGRDSKASDGDRAVARQQLKRLPADKARAEGAAKEQNLSDGQRYAKGLNEFDKGDFIQSEELKGLDEFNKGLDQSIAKTLHLHGIFGSIIGDLIDMAVKQTLLKPLAGALFGGGSGAGGGGGSFLGSLLGAIGLGHGGGGSIDTSGFDTSYIGSLSSFGGARAAGGSVVGGQLYKVN